MEGQHIDEWCELRDETTDHLRSRGHVLQPKHQPKLQLLVMPSFDDWWCIDLLEMGGVLSAYLTTWYATKDHEAFRNGIERLRHPRPYVVTLESKRLDRTHEEVRKILEVFSSLELPLDWKSDSVHLDGTPIELRVGDQPVLSWNRETPGEWQTELRTGILALYAWSKA
ncbi:MAG: hypothetical protein GC165_04845 [Armatimonadetes bacterium]|nr:hypothetical protein [Armatimonadota bacterium]